MVFPSSIFLAFGYHPAQGCGSPKLLPLQFKFAMLLGAVTQIKIDKDLISNVFLLRHALEVVNSIFIYGDSDLFFQFSRKGIRR